MEPLELIRYTVSVSRVFLFRYAEVNNISYLYVCLRVDKGGFFFLFLFSFLFFLFFFFFRIFEHVTQSLDSWEIRETRVAR